MKTPLQIRTAILTAIPDLIGIRYFGSVVQPSILMLPDPDLEDGGITLPAIIDGNVVKYQGVEVIIYRHRVLDNRVAMMNRQVNVSKKSWILLKDHGNLDNFSLTQINAFRSAANLDPITEENLSEGLSLAGDKVAKLLDLYEQLPPPSTKPDQAPLLDSIIFEFDYAGYL
jgi:uncharacterized membrane protein